MQDYRSKNDGRERGSPPGTGDCARSLLVYADEKQDEQERKMQANFDAQDLARGNGPASHLPSVILYVGGEVCRVQKHEKLLSAKQDAEIAEKLTKRMRVIAGRFRSRPLRSLRGLDIRPTSDRLRETLFDVLTAGNPEALAGSVWVDLFAGTGAVGIEALSRGAAMVYFVESSRTATAVIKANLESLGIDAGFDLTNGTSSKAIPQLERRGVNTDFVFLDPPYRLQSAYRKTLESVASSRIAEHAVVIAEHEKHFDPGVQFETLRRTRRLPQGDAILSFYQRS